MRVLMTAGVASLVLAACGPATPATETASAPADVVAPANEDLSESLPPPPDCTDIRAVIASAGEPVPFTSLRTGKVSLAGAELDDAFTTSTAPAGAKQCQIGQIEGSGPTPVIHVVNCTLFSSGMLDREKNAALAKQVFNAARAAFTACLPEDWTSRDGAVAATDAPEAMIYESQADAQRAMTGSFYTYPVRLTKEWVEGGAGRAPGWYVTLDFQKDGKR